MSQHRRINHHHHNDFDIDLNLRNNDPHGRHSNSLSN